MRVLIQRVSSACVNVESRVVGQIGRGSLIFVGVKSDDTQEDAEYLARKIAALRIFPDASGKNNLSLVDIRGELLIVSQFTLYAQVQSGNRPSYAEAAKADLARELYEHLVQQCRSFCARVETGVFQAHMEVFLVNDGPITILCSSESGVRSHI